MMPQLPYTRLVFLILGLVVFVVPTARAQFPSAEQTQALKKRIDGDYKYLHALYTHIHSHPELALREVKTAARIAAELRQAGFEVTEKVGGTGVVGVLRNGKGPTVLVRADMDALPIIERTGLPYASEVRVPGDGGREVGVMHACGHDVNMTCLVGVARLLGGMKDRWHGTLVFIGQPAEEIGAGARLMLQDGLYRRFPRPDFALGLHCDGRYAAGTVSYREGQVQANVDSVDITVRGKGGHGAAPHRSIDPVVLAARIVLDLQTLVSREQNPIEPAVVTVGSIHGGTKHNIIPNEVQLQLTVRTLSDKSRKEILEGIVRIARAAAQGARAPEPVVTLRPGEFTPSLYNDPVLTRKLTTLFGHVLGKDRVVERPMSMGGEDFSQYVRAGATGCYFFLGCQSPEKLAEAQKKGELLPSVHTDQFAPVPEPTIKTGLLAMTSAVLDLLGGHEVQGTSK
jgi:hippurate hydrolase